jgi:tRNA nucleotidyltransferase (CCA-adding enzyme)
LDVGPLVNSFTEDIQSLIDKFVDRGVIVTLVGGATRDFIRNGSLSKDLDFEARSESSLDLKDWQEIFNQVADDVKADSRYSCEELAFGILRVSCGEYECEFAPARVEVFNESAGHKNFTANFVPSEDYSVSFARRDFTLNAIGLEFGRSGQKLIDPFNGLTHLQGGELVTCGENFYKDPVRFLRMVRFKLKYTLTPNKELLQNLGQFDLSELSLFYFYKEMFHSNHWYEFFHECVVLVELQSLSVSEPLKRSLNLFEQMSELKGKVIQNSDQLVVASFLYCTDESVGYELSELLQVGRKDAKKLAGLKNLLTSDQRDQFLQAISKLKPRWSTTLNALIEAN